MRVINRDAFLAMPAGTLFSKYEPCITEGFGIKGRTISHEGRPIDFCEQDLLMPIACVDGNDMAGKLEASELSGESVAIDLACQGRDGCFDDDQLFLVWDQEDVQSLIARLQRALGGDQ